MTNTTPLLLLLDSVLSQDQERTNQALDQLSKMMVLPDLAKQSPLRSIEALERIVQTILREKPELAQIASGHDRSLPLHFACSIGNIRVARCVLNAYPSAASIPNKKGKIALHYAAREGRTAMVEFLLQHSPQTAAVLSKKDKLALHFAAGEGHLGVVRALLSAHPEGARLTSSKGKVALHFAARWGHMDVAHELVKIYPECVSHLDYDGSLPLHDAAREGQLDMAQYLVQRHPLGLRQENLRGETPLFPAVRGGHIDLCNFMVRTWPMGGKKVLQGVRDDDNVEEWNNELLELCLRGAVDIWDDPTPDIESTDESSQSSSSQTHDGDIHSAQSPSEHVGNGNDRPQTPPVASAMLDINIPRSKSPILGCDGSCRRKRGSTDCQDGSHKRSRLESFDVQDPLSHLHAASRRKFHELHAALECGASAPVLECILRRHDQVKTMDELGKYPLHTAMEFGNPNADLILENIWKPFPEASQHRDLLGRLPIHHALQGQADARLVQELLESNPSSAVKPCKVVDRRFCDKLPLQMATECDCDLSTIHLLLRCDPSVVTSCHS